MWDDLDGFSPPSPQHGGQGGSFLVLASLNNVD